ncbi:glycerol-3-phosphate responsive antiterminator [Lederbergia ruris]|uniref:Glycerol uptake operon antiterminator regulatory protein n=1 Tax=Lederbergia ruris TaxID=217495 RepID=A0ABQ4KJB1_9BACI|nr:glycerol-3-phosphate responsive antiterminator [Lederbergia ruris]GIN58045.1 glycerol uptake operon antiterminator regulatory protein [Lederbergia ruris]
MFKQPYIYTITSWDQAEKCLQSSYKTVFLLTGKMMDLPEYVYQLQNAGKTVFVHVDFISGIECHTPDGMNYVAEVIAPDGIISTRSQSIIQGKKNGLKTIQRIFLIDTHAMEKAIETAIKIQPDAIEAMPGLMPRVITELVNIVPFPVVAGGLFKTKEEMSAALEAGATAVSASNIGDV